MPGIVKAYRSSAGAVDRSNQFVCQLRTRRRHQNWSTAIRHHLLMLSKRNATNVRKLAAMCAAGEICSLSTFRGRIQRMSG